MMSKISSTSLVLEHSWQTPSAEYSANMEKAQVNYGERFLKQLRDGASTVVLTVRGKKEFLILMSGTCRY